ncbi:MAG: CYCXC family (seleno)protein [Pyrinomonadaceae bacterium]
MKSKLLFVTLLAGVIVAVAACAPEQQTSSSRAPQPTPAVRQSSVAREAPTAQTTTPPHETTGGPSATHDHGGMAAMSASDVPAFEVNAASLKNLPPTLAPDQFKGPQAIAYRMAKEIPQTLAQLPCYCHCDKGFGHKSLHSCYVDDHAAHCDVCIKEAILAYQLQKEQHLKPEQIRERIIAQYSASEME